MPLKRSIFHELDQAVDRQNPALHGIAKPLYKSVGVFDEGYFCSWDFFASNSIPSLIHLHMSISFSFLDIFSLCRNANSNQQPTHNQHQHQHKSSSSSSSSSTSTSTSTNINHYHQPTLTNIIQHKHQPRFPSLQLLRSHLWCWLTESFQSATTDGPLRWFTDDGSRGQRLAPKCLSGGLWVVPWWLAGKITMGPWGGKKGSITLRETNSNFAPENGWLEDDRFLLGPGLFSGANC